MKRTIITIDEAACTGCGLCAEANFSISRPGGKSKGNTAQFGKQIRREIFCQVKV
mgnify:CR=1 FL=1